MAGGRVAGIILSAGASSRFGSPKQLAQVGERTMLEAVVGLAADAGLSPILAVVPPGMEVPAPAKAVANDQPDEGLSRSLRLGVGALPGEVTAAVVLLGDQPTVAASVVRSLIAARGTRSVVAATDESGVVAPPVLLERTAFPLVDELVGDEGLSRILKARRELVATVTVSRHAPDIDRPSDLAALLEPCPGCGARLMPIPEGPTHAYIGASPACHAVFNAVLAREYADPSFAQVHRHTVDAYAAQHPGVDGRRERQSVAVHLIGLCHWLEHDIPVANLNAISQRLASEKRAWPWLDPPGAYRMTVHDVIAAADAEAHGRLVRAWAESVWASWSAHHNVVRRWAADALAG